MRGHLVIPAYNESARLPRFLRSLVTALRESDLSCSVEVVDDGSAAAERAAMSAVVSELRAEFPFLFELRCLPGNRGKGNAVRTAWNAAPDTVDWLLFVDADGAISASEVVRLLDEIRRNPDAADAWFASRVRMLGRSVTRDWRRHLSGRVFATFVGHYVDDRVYDSQCGLKAVRAPVWEKFGYAMTEDGFAFDVELLARLNLCGARLREFPVDWHDQAGSKVSVLRDGLRMVRAVRRISKRVGRRRDLASD